MATLQRFDDSLFYGGARARVFVYTWIIALAWGCAPTLEIDEVAEHVDALSTVSEPPFRHPLTGARDVGRADGLPGNVLPFLDAKNSPQGDRYAISDTVDVNEAGEARSYSGIAVLRRVPAERGPKDRAEAVAGPEANRRVGPTLGSRLQHAPPDESLSIVISLKRSVVPLTHLLQRAVADGQVIDDSSRELWRSSALVQKQLAVAAAQESIVARVRELGGRIVSRHENLHIVTATVPAGRVTELLTDTTVRRVDLLALGEPQSPDGIPVRTGQQLDQFIDDGFNGERGGSSDVSFAHIEGLDGTTIGIDEDLFAWQEGTSGTRIRQLFDCSSIPCATTSGYADPSHHMSPYDQGRGRPIR